MKIIGMRGVHSYQRVYLLEASGDELARLQGIPSHYDASNLSPGATINVSPLWDALREFRSAPAAVESVASKLELVVKSIRDLPAVLQAAIDPPPVEESPEP